MQPRRIGSGSKPSQVTELVPGFWLFWCRCDH